MLTRLYRGLLAMLLLLSSGCSKAASVDQAFGEAIPAIPGGVHIGMAAKELKSIQPSLSLLPYTGLGEKAEGWEISYHFDGRSVDDRGVDDGAKLLRVAAVEPFTSQSEAEAAWKTRVTEMERRLGRSMQCGADSPPSRAWRNNDLQLDFTLAPPLSTGTDTLPYRLLMEIHRVGEGPERECR